MPFSFGIVSAQWVWVALVIVFSVIEILTLGLTTIWFAIGALVMVFLAFLPIPLSVQILVFLAISGVLLFFTRPLVKKKIDSRKIKTNVDSLVGKHALVVKKIGEFEMGEAKVNGQIWTACSENGAEIAEGAKAEILRIEGVRLIVRFLEEVSE